MGFHGVRRLLPFCAMTLAMAVTGGGCSSSPSSTPVSSDVTEDAAPPAPADSTAAEPPAPIRVKISDEERAQLVAQLESDLQTATRRAASRPDTAQLTSEQRQRWDTLAQYIELAKTSRDSGDIRAAADLALKARLLADEMEPR